MIENKLTQSIQRLTGTVCIAHCALHSVYCTLFIAQCASPISSFRGLVSQPEGWWQVEWKTTTLPIPVLLMSDCCKKNGEDFIEQETSQTP